MARSLPALDSEGAPFAPGEGAEAPMRDTLDTSVNGRMLGASEPRELLSEPLLTAAEVGTLLGGIPGKTVLEYARDGRLPCVRIGKHVRFVRCDVARALEDQRWRR